MMLAAQDGSSHDLGYFGYICTVGGNTRRVVNLDVNSVYNTKSGCGVLYVLPDVTLPSLLCSASSLEM